MEQGTLWVRKMVKPFWKIKLSHVMCCTIQGWYMTLFQYIPIQTNAQQCYIHPRLHIDTTLHYTTLTWHSSSLSKQSWHPPALSFRSFSGFRGPKDTISIPIIFYPCCRWAYIDTHEHVMQLNKPISHPLYPGKLTIHKPSHHQLWICPASAGYVPQMPAVS